MSEIKLNYVFAKKNEVHFSGWWSPFSTLNVDKLDVTDGTWVKVGEVHIGQDGNFTQPISFQKSSKDAYTIRFIDPSSGAQSQIYNIDSKAGMIIDTAPKSTPSILPTDMTQPSPTAPNMDGATKKAYQIISSPNQPVWNEKTGQWELTGKPVFNPADFPNAYQAQVPPYEKIKNPAVDDYGRIIGEAPKLSSIQAKAMPLIGKDGKPLKLDEGSVVV